MGRGRTKGKKLSATNQVDSGSGEEEKIPAQKRRGRPQKSLKDDDIDEDGVQELEEEEDSEDTTGLPNKDAEIKTTQNRKKRKRNVQVKEKVDSVKEESGNGNEMRSSTEESNKSSGFRPNGNRRKNKPRRAAEAVVECCY